jgi:hypothetical protein
MCGRAGSLLRHELACRERRAKLKNWLTSHLGLGSSEVLRHVGRALAARLIIIGPTAGLFGLAAAFPFNFRRRGSVISTAAASCSPCRRPRRGLDRMTYAHLINGVLFAGPIWEGPRFFARVAAAALSPERYERVEVRTSRWATDDQFSHSHTIVLAAPGQAVSQAIISAC